MSDSGGILVLMEKNCWERVLPVMQCTRRTQKLWGQLGGPSGGVFVVVKETVVPVHELDNISESMSATGPGLDPGVMSSLRDFGALPELGRLVDNEMVKKLLSMG